MTSTPTSCSRSRAARARSRPGRTTATAPRRNAIFTVIEPPTPTRAGMASARPPAARRRSSSPSSSRPSTTRTRAACPGPTRPATPGAEGGDHQHRWRPGRRVHRGRRLDLVHAVQPRGSLDRVVPGGVGRRRRPDRAALRRGRRPARRLGRRDPDRRLAELDDGHRRHPRRAGGDARPVHRVPQRHRQRVADEPQLVPARRQGRGDQRAADRERDGDARLRRGAARGCVRQHGGGPRGRRDHLRLGLRRPRHWHRRLDRGGSVLHVHAGRHVHREGDRHRRERRQGHRDGPGHRDRRRPVPDGWTRRRLRRHPARRGVDGDPPRSPWASAAAR